MNIQYLSVSEVAEKLSVSKQYIYKLLNNKLNKYVQLVDGVKMLNIAVLEEFKTEKVEQHPTKEEQPKSTDDKQADTCLINLMKSTIEELSKQLTVKDKQISDLNDRLSEAHMMATQAQQLHGADKVLEITDGKKKHWWNKKRTY